MKFKIKYVKDKIGNGYVGMNYFAAKELKINYPYSKNTILIFNGLSNAERKRTILHEKVEYLFMEKGNKYKEAHRISNKLEDYKSIKIIGP